MPEPLEIPGFRPLQILGQGGMGVVYLAEQVELGRRVALKVMRTDRTEERSRRRFLREAATMARLAHPHLIELYDSGLHEGMLWIALELIEGRSLDQVLAQEGAFEPDRAREIMLQVGEALQAMHQQDVLHRDVKPANIMLEEGGRAVLMDLGLVLSADQTALTRTGHILGTPVYMAPELLTGGTWERDGDWFAWALTWWELLAGSRPWTMHELMTSLGRGERPVVPPARSPRGPVPPRDAEVIRRCLVEKVLRLQGMDAIRQVLEGGADEGRDTCELPPAIPGASTLSRSLAVDPLSSDGETLESGQQVVPASLLPAWLKGLLAAVFVTLVLLGLRKLGRRADPPVVAAVATPTTASAPTPASEPRLETAYRDRFQVVLRGRASVPGEVRARVARGSRLVPAPVFALDDGTFLIWLAGLRPGESGVVSYTGTGEAGPEEQDFSSLASLSEGPESPPPAPLDRFLEPRDVPELQVLLESLREVIEVDTILDGEPAVEERGSLRQFRNLPPRAWPVLLAWMEEGGSVSCNLLRCLQWAAETFPPPVAWHLVHRLADPEAPLVRQPSGDVAADLSVLRGSDLPAAGWRRVLEWTRESPGSCRGLYHFAVQLERQVIGQEAAAPFPFRVPGWTPRREDQPLEPLPAPIAELRTLAGRTVRGDEEALASLLRASQGQGSQADWATVMLAATRRSELIQGLLERFRTEQGTALEAVDAALRGLRTRPGFWSTVGDGMLLRRHVAELPEPTVESPTGAELVFRPELDVFYGVFDRNGHEVLVRGSDGRERRYVVSASHGYRQVDPPDESR